MAAVHYVDLNSTNATPPYTNWASAATNIQDAVDAAVAGDEVVVTNGIYATGGRAYGSPLTNRVVVGFPLWVHSVNGPQFTVIRGEKAQGGGNGDGAIRCVYLSSGASLSGFTLTNGATHAVNGYPTYAESGGGGVWCLNAVVSNCVLTANSAYQLGGGAYQGTLNNCTLAGNSCDEDGGGASYCTLNRCSLSANLAGTYNGGDGYGGGAYQCSLNKCTLTGNSATVDGGGASDCTLNNCALSGNLALYGGGASQCSLNDCTLTGNSAYYNAGGVRYSGLYNCIIYFNNAPEAANYDFSSTLNYCCATPLQTNGVANISPDPQLASASHLSAASPCRGAGNSASASGTDIDGEPWANPPSIGCDEYRAGAVTGQVAVAISAMFTNVVAGLPLGFTALIEGQTTGSIWDFGDGMTATNQPFTAHSWTALGNYAVILRAFNEGLPGGISATITVHVVTQPIHYVDARSATPVAPYVSWATAATNIQDAVDAATEAGAVVLVTNGVYATGGRAVFGTLTNRVAVDKPIALRSVNGPYFTIIQGQKAPDGGNGDGAIRCVCLTNGASLDGFTLTNGATRAVWPRDPPPYRQTRGGGLWCESTNGVVVSNCVVAGNSANDSGGGVHQGTLNNCTLNGNSALFGGGASYCTLNNCTISGNTENSGGGGGGVYSALLNNCTLTGNSAYSGGGAYESSLNHCTLSANSASGTDGGGAYDCILNNCTLSGNSAFGHGGGAAWGGLINCALFGNSALYGGGTYSSGLNNCTLTGNSAFFDGGGAHFSTLYNCIVYFNTAPLGSNYESCTLNYSCTTPEPTNGTGNISLDPQLVSPTHLSADSACRGAGNAAGASGVDIDADPWGSPPSIGCDEYFASSSTGMLTVAISASYTYLGSSVPVDFVAQISGRASASRWEFDDGTILSNRLCLSRSWSNPGDYTVALRAYNESNPGGVSTTVTIHVVPYPTHYVALSSTNPVAPYTSWTTAATNIPDAVAVAAPGALVLVTNGVYATGGQAVYGTMTNRVVVNKPLALRSVNGPQFTVIQGQQAPGTNNGDGAIRCVYLSDGASLSGFTLTNGATRAPYADAPPYRETSGGGLWCESAGAVVSNCVVTGNSAYIQGGGVSGGTLNDCTLSGNSAMNSGGGASSNTLNNCILINNFAGGAGGGVDGGTLKDCTLIGNSASSFGGGAYSSMLTNCILSGNSADNGGGAYSCNLNDCALRANSSSSGGGAAYSTLNNSALAGNSAKARLYGYALPAGGGALGCALNNCTVIGNSPDGAYGGTMNNCILYFNTNEVGVSSNYSAFSVLNYCCTTPQPTNGVGNISVDPQLASASHLSAGSPCRGAGNVAYATGTDIDGEDWANPPSIGCDEYHPGAVTGPLTVDLAASVTNVAAGDPVFLTALIEGRTTDSVWEFGDGGVEMNRPYTTHAWAAPGDYLVALWCFNESYPQGVEAVATVRVLQRPLHSYVSANSTNPIVPYISWDTAATNIQDAADWAAPGALVEVTNGFYAGGGRDGNGVKLDKSLVVRSVNGAQFTTISGGGRCVYLTNNASLSGFTLASGSAQYGAGAYGGTLNNCVLIGNHGYIGGGAYGCVLNNCTLSGNSAYARCVDSPGGNGGGAAYSTLNSCTLTGNSAEFEFDWCYVGLPGQFHIPNRGDFADGGGAYYCTLHNCTLTDNSAINRFYYNVNSDDFGHYGDGGGAAYCWLYNCILAFNSARDSSGSYYNRNSTYGDYGLGGGAYRGGLLQCVVFLNQGGGELYGNTSWSVWRTDPLFGDGLRLQSNSPCINAGNNAYAPAGPDLDGNPRIASGTVDIGAYEYQSPVSQISYAWLQQYGLPVNSSTDTADPDGDAVDNYHEWLAGTDPTNPLSSPAQLTITPSGTNVLVTWSTNAVGFTLQSTTNLNSTTVWVTNSPAPVILNGQNTVTNPIVGPQQFYRLIH